MMATDERIRTRKTIEVKYLRYRINKMLALASVSTLEKRALCSLLEEVSMVTNNYYGFRWLMPRERAEIVAPSDADYYDRFYFGRIRNIRDYEDNYRELVGK